MEQEFVRVYADTADYFMESIYENQDSGATAVLAEEGNLTQALALALEGEQWDSAQLVVQPLAQVYRMQKRYPELRPLRRQLLDTVAPNGGGAAEAEGRGAVDLWLYLMGTEANEAADLLEWDYAQELNSQLMEYLTSLPEGGGPIRAPPPSITRWASLPNTGPRQEARPGPRSGFTGLWPSSKRGRTGHRWPTITTAWAR